MLSTPIIMLIVAAPVGAVTSIEPSSNYFVTSWSISLITLLLPDPALPCTIIFSAHSFWSQDDDFLINFICFLCEYVIWMTLFCSSEKVIFFITIKISSKIIWDQGFVWIEKFFYFTDRGSFNFVIRPVLKHVYTPKSYFEYHILYIIFHNHGMWYVE